MKRRVLVFPAGTEIGLEIYHALEHCKEVCLFGAGQDISNPARFVYPSYHPIPAIGETDWLEALISLCRSLCIDYIFPAYDDVIVALSRVSDRLPAKLVSSPAQACEVTRSKSATYRALKGIVPTPDLYGSADEISTYPVFVKPDCGQGSIGAVKVTNAEELASALNVIQDGIICEYLPGDEYTVDCFSDREHGLLFAQARQRRRMRNGIAVNTLTCQIPEVSQFAQRIGDILGLRGAWFFQMKRARDGRLVLLEVAPRIAGAMAAHRVAGVNFPLLSLFEDERLPLSLRPLDCKIEMDRALCNRYRHSISFNTLYIDLDDTLLVDAQINLLAMKLIFQSINQGKRLVLLTRHKGDLDITLRRHRLLGLFDEVVHLGADEKKSSFIQPDGAIFVDDSFSERMEVADCHHIPTFDCSMIEMLTEQAEFMNDTECQ